MNKVVLKSLFTENFSSFADRVTFTTEIDQAKSEYAENTFSCHDSSYNKVSFLYGANGSGKSSFCKILLEIKRMIGLSSLNALNDIRLLNFPPLKNMDKPIENFAFDKDYADKPTKLGIEIILDNETIYNYEFSMRNKKIEHEQLTRKYRRTEILLERTSPNFKDISLKSEFKSFEQYKSVVKEEALCLPMADFLNNALAKRILSAIQSIDFLNMTAPRMQPSNPKASFTSERLNKYCNVLKIADPTLRKMHVSFKEKELENSKINIDGFDNREIIATQMTVSVKGEHAVYKDGEEIDKIPLNFFDKESLGTVKIFTALPYIYNALESGGVLILDEIENGLHLSLVKEIIDLFKNKDTNPLDAQLICTSHQPLLISENTRRDQVWIASKDKCGKSRLNRMSELSTPRAKINLTNKLLEGAFGCNPEHFFAKYK